MATAAAPGAEPRHVVVRYRTTVQQADENQALVEAVFAELDATAPEGIRYATFRLDDGVTFVHVATIETDDGSNPLEDIEAFRTFSQGVAQRCQDTPVAAGARLVGSYRLIGATIPETSTTSPNKERNR